MRRVQWKGAPGRRASLPAVALVGALLLGVPSAMAQTGGLSEAEVQQVVAQAAAGALRRGLPATIAVADAEGRTLAVFRMSGAPAGTRIAGTRGRGLEGLDVPAEAAALSKAGTAALLSSTGNAFTTRTASFIVQEHFPPAIASTPGGPLFGVQFSSLACSDVVAEGLPLGLAGDPGGVPLYRGGQVVGGVGVEGDGTYGVDRRPVETDTSPEEAAALDGAASFSAPDEIRADRILVDGIRLPFADPAAEPTASGTVAGSYLVPPQTAAPSSFVPQTLGAIAVEGVARYPVRPGRRLSAADVTRILSQAASQSAVTRAAIRRPLGSSARVSIAVVDVDGGVLGFVRLPEAPGFGYDVAVQKARTASFFSAPDAGQQLRAAGLGAFVTSEILLDGSVALSSRTVGFLAQPFFPPGIEETTAGPFSVPSTEWSPFHTGLQLQLAQETLVGGGRGACGPIRRLANGITIFPGGLPLYKDGALAGGIGVSGDGVDQDDIIAAAGAAGFEPPAGATADRVILRGVRLPYTKFPRHPDL